MKMNTAIQCIILLACTVICTSATIKRCQCLRTSRVVNHTLIVDVIEYNPRPYCNKKEVIVTLEDKRSVCLIPDTKFTKAVLKMIQQRKAAAAKMNTTDPKTTTASATATATASETIAPTSS